VLTLHIFLSFNLYSTVPFKTQNVLEVTSCDLFADEKRSHLQESEKKKNTPLLLVCVYQADVQRGGKEAGVVCFLDPVGLRFLTSHYSIFRYTSLTLTNRECAVRFK